MKRRKDSFFGLHFDYHAQPKDGIQGKTLREEEIREICRLLKPDFIQIDCKGHPGWASYPSKIGNAMPEFAQDTLALWRRVTREENVALYMHYSGVYDIKYCKEHPEQAAMRADGTLTDATRTDGTYADDILIPQLCELAGVYGVDGVWVDGECWSTKTDFRPESLAAFEKAPGIDLGGKLPATPEDPYYQEYREYHRELFRRYLRYYVDQVHLRYPDFQIASNWAFSDHMPEPICANVDFLSGDLNPENSFHSARYAARALAQQEFPWDLMSWNFRMKAGTRAACMPKHPNQILQEAAAVISLGGAYQNYITQYKDGSPNLSELRELVPLADFMRERQAYCFRGTPVHQAALLLSTDDRKKESKYLYSRTGYEKVMGMTALLCDVGHSLEIICEHTLKKNCDLYSMIVIPELSYGLAPETVTLLLDYANCGGKLVLIGKNTCRMFAEAGAPFEVVAHDEFFGVGEKAYDNGGDNGHGTTAAAQYRTYAFTVDGKAFGSLFSPCEIVAEKGKQFAFFSDHARAAGTPLAAEIPYGAGSITAIGFDLGSQYLSGTQYLHRSLIRLATEKLYEPLARIESVYGILEVVCLNKDGRLMLQLVNGGGNHANPTCATDDYIPPALDIELSIALPEKPDQLILQPEGRSLPFVYQNGRAYVSIDRVNIHSIVEVVPSA
ncbi:MAG: hypothetical protein IJY42_00455 [Clostridia bacterium]|nr:hypothetical protein [Clostridia bacterium]